MRKIYGGVAAMLATVALATPASAQLINNPVYPVSGAATGLTLNGDFGYCASDCGTNPMFYGGRAVLGVAGLGIGAGIGLFNPDVTGADNEITVGANVGFEVLPSTPATPISVGLNGGIGYVDLGGATTLMIPLGVSVGFDIPMEGPVSLAPWVMPRVTITRVDVAGVSGTNTDFGASGGIMLGLSGGFGAHVALDYTSGSGANPILIGAGVHYSIAIPSLMPAGM